MHVAYSRHAISGCHKSGSGGKVKWQIHRVDESKSSTQRMSNHGYLCSTKLAHTLLHRSQNICSRESLLGLESIVNLNGGRNAGKEGCAQWL